MTNKYKTVYDQVTKLIDQSLEIVLKKAASTNENLDLEGAIANSKRLLESYQQTVNDDIRSLQESAEWDIFTIAFYGETNAGKSTIIETLRILLGDREKITTQERFKALAQDLHIDPDSIVTLENSIKTLELQLREIQDQGRIFEQKLQNEEQQQIAKLETLKAIIKRKRKSMSLWQKLVFFFKKLAEELTLPEHESQLIQIRTRNKLELNNFSTKLGKVSTELNARISEQSQLEKSFEKLVPLQDGQIIGNGRSDFTQQSQSYFFTAKDQKFQLIDVPGIEGDEKQVMSAIDASVKKAHAAFYVTRSAQPPGSGSEGQDGTIHKIKRQLGKQTEVWAIYNKSATNPKILQNKKLITENDKKGLEDMEKSLINSLGQETYRGCVTISGMPAFLASASCLLPNNPHFNSRNKFLKEMSEKEILQHSGMNDFLKFIRNEICQNLRKKIDAANLKKVRSCLQEGIDKVRESIKLFFEAEKKLEIQHKSTSKQLDAACSELSLKLKSECSGQLEKKKHDMRTDIYNYIEMDKSNDDFKEYMTTEFKKLKASIGKDLEAQFTTVFDDFKNKTIKIINNHQKNVNEILHYTINNPFSSLKPRFNIDFKMDNGINVLGLITTLGGAAGLVWTTFLASSPAGWTVAAVLGAVGLVFNFYKAVRSFFSSDYKKEQQRQAVDENLDNFFTKLTEKLEDNIQSASTKIDEALQDTKKQMLIPHEQCVNTKAALEGITIKMMALRNGIFPKQATAVTAQITKSAATSSAAP